MNNQFMVCVASSLLTAEAAAAAEAVYKFDHQQFFPSFSLFPSIVLRRRTKKSQANNQPMAARTPLPFSLVLLFVTATMMLLLLFSMGVPETEAYGYASEFFFQIKLIHIFNKNKCLKKIHIKADKEIAPFCLLT
jgi:hypothetical protein